MSKIRIKNFGPIKEGYLEDDGWLDVKKVTVFIGNQGSGKSTVAKAISTMMWMEKALNRGDIEEKNVNNLAAFHQCFSYQGLKGYFNLATQIEYVGDRYELKYLEEGLNGQRQWPMNTRIENKNYRVPQIMYIPAERNFFSVVLSAFDSKSLPEAFLAFAKELKKAQIELNQAELSLPTGFGNIRYQYDPVFEMSFLIGNDYELNLADASSGYHSFIPLYLVSRFLSRFAQKENNSQELSASQSIRRDKEISVVMRDKSLSNNEKIDKVLEIDARYINTCFINIVEEPEQNLFPTSQWEMLKSLLEFNNTTEGNKLIMTTHSPYIINYLTLAVKAGMLKKQIGDNAELLNKLEQVVPLASAINPDDLVIYEMDEKTGTIKKLETYNDLPSDENYLNNQMAETNELFARLLDIQQAI